MEKMRYVEVQQKVKVFGIGGCGNNIVHNLKANARLSKIIINTDITHLNNNSSGSTDASILCGRETCRGLSCGGNISLGYKSAKESFSNMMYLFDHNQINVFICGLGGGCGSGVTKYLLKELKKRYKDNKDYNKCNILICTFPLDVEKRRVKKAKNAIKILRNYCDLIMVIEMESFFQVFKKRRFDEFFVYMNGLVRDYLVELSRLKNRRIIDSFEVYKRKIITIKSPSDFKKYFLCGDNNEAICKNKR